MAEGMSTRLISYSMVRQVQTQTSKDEIAEFLKEID